MLASHAADVRPGVFFIALDDLNDWIGCHGEDLPLVPSRATDDKFDIPDDYGWRPLVASIEIVNVDGKHLTMFEPQHVASLAREINKRLDPATR